jgi:hypothetical protein
MNYGYQTAVLSVFCLLMDNQNRIPATPINKSPARQTPDHCFQLKVRSVAVPQFQFGLALMDRSNNSMPLVYRVVSPK